MGDQLAEVLRRLRSQAGLTQEDLAERSGVSARTIRGIETGKRRNPQLASVRRLAEALSLPADQRQQLLTVATGTVSAAQPAAIAPRQLPAPPRYFVGRTAELGELTSALDDAAAAGRTVLISALAGAGGIGKTALALHWARTNLHRFPDGQLFVDLRGFSPAGQPVAPGTAVRGFLDAFGVDPGRIPADLDAQAALYRSLVADRRMLIVLDNAADAAQVVPLLPGSPTCTVLVTSRQHLTSLITRHGAHHLKLRVLTEDDARHLLVTRIGADRAMAEPAAAEELLACCGGFALALDIVAARTKMNGHTTLADAAAELRDDATRLLDDDDPAASLPAVLSWSYRALTAEQRTVFGLLGVAPGTDIALPAAASLTGLAVPRARAVLRALEDASLLDRHPAGRYTMHDLIRAYATDTAHHDLPEDTRRAALRRVLDFYTHTAHTADQLLARRRPIQLDPPAPGAHPQPLPDAAAALAWFDTEHPTLLAAARDTAISHGWHPTVWQLAWTMDTYLYRRGHRHDRLAVWRAAVAATAHLPDPTSGVHAHRAAGNACAELGRHDEATGYLHQSLALAEQHGDPAQQANTHHILAWAWGLRDDRRRALEHATQALDLHRTFDHPAGKAGALNLVGWCAARLGDYDSARAHCQAALTLNQHQHNPAGEASTLDTLGYIDHETGHHQQAIGHYQHALTLLRDLGDTYHRADILDRLGHPHDALDQHEDAGAAWREALELYQQQGRDEDVTRVQRQLADLSKRQGTDRRQRTIVD